MLEDCYSILDLRDRARRRLPGAIFNMIDGAAETEATSRRNTIAFDEVTLIPRCLVDVGNVNTSIRVLGQELKWPVFCSPTGGSRFFHTDGELAVARAAAKAGTLYGLSTASTYSIEEVAAASDGPKMFQLYICKDRQFTRTLVDRAKRSGYAALCVTVDTPVVGKYERDLRAGFSGSLRQWPPSTIMGFARHPQWVLKRLGKRARSLANFSDPQGKPADPAVFGEQLDSSVTWRDIREIRDTWGGPLALKGVMSIDDARRASDMGVTAVIVSNHGGRQLDGAAATIEVLPEFVHAVGDRLEVILDGGVRRGVHVLKALACGAKACSIGRPYLYGLGAGGEAGVAKALEILRTELVRAMQLAGCPDLASIDGNLIKKSAGNATTTIS
jgi:L-lactate dehydrogenase (cytochrome)